MKNLAIAAGGWLAAMAGQPALAQSSGQQLDCIVEPAMTLKIGSPIATTLAGVDVKRGDRVMSGQVLARLDANVERADLALAETRARSTAEVDSRRSKLEFATADLSRGTRLMESANIAPQKLDELRTNFRVAQQDAVIAELNRQLAALELGRVRAVLEQRMIHSPVDGIVTQRALGPGEFVHQDNQILTLAVISPLHVQAYPPVRLWSHIKLGQVARVLLTEPPGRALDATVTVIDQVFDAGSGTFGVQLDLPNPDSALPAGQRCHLSFDGSTPMSNPSVR